MPTMPNITESLISMQTECNITYRLLKTKNDRLEVGENLFEYTWLHLPTNKSGTSYLATSSQDILPLINYWNRKDHWKYVLTSARF